MANGLASAGVAPGDPVGLLLPMTVEAIAVLLGIIRAGCVAVAVAESFAPPEIELRLRIGGARLVITQDTIPRLGGRLPLYPKLALATGVRAVVIPSEGELGTPLRPGDRLWSDFLSPRDEFTPVPREPAVPVALLFSSGTTGDPKAILWSVTRSRPPPTASSTRTSSPATWSPGPPAWAG